MFSIITKQKTAFLFLIIGVLYIFPLTAQITVDRYMGVNTLREDPVEKMKAVGFIREYHSWYLNEGNPSLVQTDYSPSYPNAIYRWNTAYQDLTYTRFDEFYDEIRNTHDIQIAPSFLGNLFQIVDPDRYTDEGDNHIVQEQIPVASGANKLDPASYKAHAAYLFQYAARYGHQVFPTSTFNSLIIPKTHAEEVPQTGLGIVEYMESWNEQDKWWWQGSHPDTYFTPQEYMTMLSADYDGHGNTLGLGIGIKNADPNMKVVMGGLAQADLSYIREMVEWAKINRGPLGSSVDTLPFNVLNIHHYIGNNENFLQSTQGVSPEHADLRGFLKTFDDYRDSLNTAMGTNLELWLSEFGYDTFGPGSTGQPVVIAPQIGQNDSYEVQGQWITRIYLEALAAEIDRAMLFFLRDEQTPYAGLYTSSGLLENAVNGHKPKNSWFYTYTMKNVLTDMVFDADVSPCSDTTCVRVYKFKELNNGAKKVYAIWSPTASAKVVNYDFDHEDVENAILVKMELPSIWGSQTIIEDSDDSVLTVTEKPMFLIIDGTYFSPPNSCSANPVVENATCGSLNVRLNAPNGSGTYQLWHMQGNYSAVDFSHRLATLVDENLSPADSVITVAGLQSSQPYTFFLFPEGIGADEPSKICTATGVTTNSTCKIIVDPNWIFDEYKNHINPDGLFDNQNDFDPMCNPNEGFPSQSDLWGFNYDLTDSMNLSLDLQDYYYIDALTLHDEGSRGFFTIQIADSPNGPWTTVEDYLTIDYNKWVTLTNIIPADKPVRYMRFIAEKNDAAKVGELYICGRLSGYNPDILPGVAINGLVKNITCESLALEWGHPFDEDIASYKILEGNTVLANIPYNPGVQTYPISNLAELTTYNYSIITVDNIGQESADTLKLSATTFGGINQCKIPLTTSMIFDHFNKLANAERLVDEQSNYDPICNPYTVPYTNFWGVDYPDNGTKEHVSLNLGGYYFIDKIIMHDGTGQNGHVDILMATSPNGPWTNIVSHDAVIENGWATFDNPIPNNGSVRYLRLEASIDNQVNVGELFICGTLDSNTNPNIKPGKGRFGQVTDLSCTEATLAWTAPLDDDIEQYRIYLEGNLVDVTTLTNITINTLIANTNYAFKIVTEDTAGNESVDSLTIAFTTNMEGACDLICNLTCSCAICVQPSWLTSLNPTTNFQKENFFDEQDKVPFCGMGGTTPASFYNNTYANGGGTNSAPDTVLIDLQKVYDISTLHIFFQGGSSSGNFIIQYLDNNNTWQELINHVTNANYGWTSFSDLNTTTQYLRTIQTDNNSQIGEIGICGNLLCEASLDLVNPITVSDTFQAGVITSSASLATGIEVGYFAETYITLKQGFHAVAGADFLAQIAPCSSNNFVNQEELYAFAKGQTSLLPERNKLEVYPNPFHTTTTLAYHLTTTAPVQLDIFDTKGKVIKNLINKQLVNKGHYQITLSKESIESGFYITRLVIGKEVFVKKIVVLEN